MKVTPETLTEEMIRALRGRACDDGDVTTWRICDIALGGPTDDLCCECPTCGSGPDQPCRSTKRRSFKNSVNTRARLVRTHPARKFDKDVAMERVCDAINARNAPLVANESRTGVAEDVDYLRAINARAEKNP